MSSLHTKRRVLVLNGYGDDLSEQAMFAGFAQVFGDATEPLELDVTIDQSPVRSFPFRATTIETINETYDMVLVGGGGVLSHYVEDVSLSGWTLDISEDALALLRVPLVVYAAGVDPRPFGPDFPIGTAEHLSTTIRQAAHFSVRDSGSQRFIQNRLGVDSDVRVVPDPTVHVTPSEIDLPWLDDLPRPIGVSLSFDRLDEQYGAPFASRFEQVMGELLSALVELADVGHAIVFCPARSTENDREVARLIAGRLPEESFFDLSRELPSLYDAPSMVGPAVLAAVYRRLDVVLAQTAQSAILPLVNGTPVVSLSSSEAVAWVASTYGMPEEFQLDLMTPAEDLARELGMAASMRDGLGEAARARNAELVATSIHATRVLVRDHLAGFGSLRPTCPVPRTAA